MPTGAGHPHGRIRMDLRVQNHRQHPNQMLGSDPIQFNDGDDDIQSNGDGQMASSADGPESNRPAANANLSDTVDATTEDFEFQDEADDFLGLEGEVQAMEAASDASSPEDGNFDVGEDGDLALSDGWLLEVASEENTAPAGAPEASTDIDSAEPEQIEQLVSNTIASTEVAEEDFDVETMAGMDEGYEFESDEDHDEDHDEEFDEEYEDGEDGEFGEAAPQRSKKLVVIGFCAGILGTVGLLMLDSSSTSDGVGTEVASGTTPAPTEPVSTEGTETAADASLAEVAVNIAEPESTEPIENVLEGLLAAPTETTVPVSVEPIVFDALPDPSTSSNPIAAMPGLPGMPDLVPVEIDMPTQNTPRTLLAQLAVGAESGDISGFMDFTLAPGAGFIWTGEQVPMESISTKGRILTPAVGMVRATMNSGELFEGNLYAVGSDRVWIEMGPGRVGLDGKKVQKIERVVAETIESEQAEAALGQRVRVRAAGGVLYGKVKSRVGNRVTIITDKGARITLIDPEIEAIGRLSGLVLN